MPIREESDQDWPYVGSRSFVIVVPLVVHGSSGYNPATIEDVRRAMPGRGRSMGGRVFQTGISAPRPKSLAQPYKQPFTGDSISLCQASHACTRPIYMYAVILIVLRPIIIERKTEYHCWSFRGSTVSLGETTGGRAVGRRQTRLMHPAAAPAQRLFIAVL